MKIVVLDGFTLNPGDLTWNPLLALGACEIFDRTAPTELIARAATAEILLTNKTVLTAASIEQLPLLKYVGVPATGTNVVDLAAARQRSVTVTNVPAYGTRSVAQATFALLLELTNRVGHHARAVQSGRWTRNSDWCFWDAPLIELDGLTLGIIGLGRIGRAVAELAHGFGMNVIAYTPRGESPLTFVKATSLDEVFRQSDVVSLHCPLTPQTQKLISADRLRLMKPTAFLLNTGRGPLIDEPALAEALNHDRLAGAAVDVLSIEPPPPDNPLLRAKNCLITPHNAWGTQAARKRLLNIAVDNLRAFLASKPVNVVN